MHLDGQLASTIEAAGRQIDGADDRSGIVGEQHLSVKLQVLKFMNFDSNVMHGSQTADFLHEFPRFERVDGLCQHMDFHTPLLDASPSSFRQSILNSRVGKKKHFDAK